MIHDQALKETALSGEQVFEGKLIRVEHWQVALPNSRTSMREVVRHNGAVAVVPLDENGCVTLVRQYRFAIDQLTWEIPAGKLDSPDEDPLSAARRELEEETGLHAANWTRLTTIDTTPGFCDERITLYLATGLSQHQAHTDEDEFLAVSRFPLEQAVARVMSGEFRDSKTIIGLLMAQKAHYLSKGEPLFPLSNIQRTRCSVSSMSENNL